MKKEEILKINIDINKVDLFPVVLDYDFIKQRPRGGSSRVDFFNHSILSQTLDTVDKPMPHLFIKKAGLLFEKGIFLIDFSLINEENTDFIKFIEDMKFNEVYIENSKKYNIKNIISNIQSINIILLEFIDQ